jgi:hypothetical protein
VGVLKLTRKQAERLGLKSYCQISPLLEKCCLRLSANESYQNAEEDIEALTGVKVGHSTMQRLVLRVELPWPQAKQAIAEVSVDGRKVRLRGQPKEGSFWKDHKSVRLQGIYYGAFFHDNQALIDYVNCQPLVNPLVCLGDGHDGVWNLVQEFGRDGCSRCEILDGYHLKENLYKIGGSLKRLQKAESLLWRGRVSETLALLADCPLKGAQNFSAYLNKHRQRLINYSYYQSEQLCSIGSGAVESAIKQISARMKISGASWKADNVNQALLLRCAYLNGLLAI